jgi:hypothetical protein
MWLFVCLPSIPSFRGNLSSKKGAVGEYTLVLHLTLTLALPVTLTLTLALPVTLTLSSPPSRRRGGAVWEVFAHRVEMLPSWEKNSWLISVPVRPSDLRMAIPGPPHSSESLASRVAARHASAFVLESFSSLLAFHASSPCVMWVSSPLVLTRTSPAVADLDERAVGSSAPLNMASPTGFWMPLAP